MLKWNGSHYDLSSKVLLCVWNETFLTDKSILMFYSYFNYLSFTRLSRFEVINIRMRFLTHSKVSSEIWAKIPITHISHSAHLAHQCIQFVFSSGWRWSGTCSSPDQSPSVAWFWVSTFLCHRVRRLSSHYESQHVLPMQVQFDHLHVAIQPISERNRESQKKFFSFYAITFGGFSENWIFFSSLKKSFLLTKTKTSCIRRIKWKIYSPYIFRDS